MQQGVLLLLRQQRRQARAGTQVVDQACLQQLLQRLPVPCTQADRKVSVQIDVHGLAAGASTRHCMTCIRACITNTLRHMTSTEIMPFALSADFYNTIHAPSIPLKGGYLGGKPKAPQLIVPSSKTHLAGHRPEQPVTAAPGK